jgi:dienelactone hydrolase
MNRFLLCLLLLMICHAGFFSRASRAEETLPGTAQLEWSEESLPDRVMDGAHLLIEKKIADAQKERARYWPDLNADEATWQKAVVENREELRKIIGAVDPLVATGIEQFGAFPESGRVFHDPRFDVLQVRWGVLEGVFAEGLLVTPSEPPVAAVVLIPDADQTPEQLLGLQPGIPRESQIARHLIANRIEVLIPTLISREKFGGENPRLKQADQTNREWIYRQAFHMGRHLIGYEVQEVLAAVDWFSQRDPDRPIGVAGYGEGALIAFYAAALETRVQSVLISGYFDARDAVWAEPIYRNVWSLLDRFGDAEITTLILPRKLTIERSESPTIAEQKGDWATAPFERVAAEVARVQNRQGMNSLRFVHGKDGATVGPYSRQAVSGFLSDLGIEKPASPADVELIELRQAFSTDRRQKRLVNQLQSHVQQLVRNSEQVRDDSFLYKVMPELNEGRWTTERQLSAHSVDKFVAGAKEFRQRFATEAIGIFDDQLLPFNARTRRVIETDDWIAYDVVLDVFDKLIAWGVLVVPKDIQPGERRPVVVCQHGRQGLPRDTVDAHKTAYNDFAAKLAERGFITFAPHNLYRGEDRYRWLDRKANSVGHTLFSFIVAQHDQILRWLDSLEFVDGERIAFYGLSYGGETAMRVPAILEKYCLSICSGDFNQWTRKVAATDQTFSFMNTIEWEMPYWNWGETFDYAEMSYLMVPRPFMVERGHLDLVGRDQWVAYEFAKVRWLYAQLGIADRDEITYFQGGHSIRGEATFAFLHKHLDWPEPGEK